jgi:hypothetical protein
MLIENFLSLKLLPFAKYLIVAISLHFGETAALKRVFFFFYLMRHFSQQLVKCLFIHSKIVYIISNIRFYQFIQQMNIA